MVALFCTLNMPQTPKLKALIKAKCPRCRRGDIFSGSMYGFNWQKTNEFCPHCGFRFEVEPGYFYAAMYVSYALNIAEIVTISMLTFYITRNDDSPWFYIIIILIATLLLAPFNFRYSRVLLLYWLSPKVKYNAYYDKE